MKKPVAKSLRAKQLDVTALGKVSGGRGGWCGSVVHCENCGDVFDPMCATAGECNGMLFFTGFEMMSTCPNCGNEI